MEINVFDSLSPALMRRRAVAVEQQVPLNASPDSSDSSEMEINEVPDLILLPDLNRVPENEGEKDEYWRYIPLLKAALIGDWDAARRFFVQDESAIMAPINNLSHTALYIAVRTGERAIHFVEKLVELMPVEALELCDKRDNTALHVAAMVGNTRAAVVLVQKNPYLPYIRGDGGRLPLHYTATNGRKDTLLFLLTVTRDDHVSRPFSNESNHGVVMLFVDTIAARFYDVALNLAQRYPQVAKSKDWLGTYALKVIAHQPSAFPSGSRLKFWQRIIYCCVPVKLETNPIKDPMSRGDLENPATDRRSQVILQNYDWSIWAQLLKDFSISGCQKLQTMLWKVFEFLVPLIKPIREQKQMHLEVLALLKFVCEEVRSLNDSDTFSSFTKGPVNSATKLGIHEVIEEIVDSFPMSMWTKDKDNRNLFQRAVIYRHENVFNLLYQMGDHKLNVTTAMDNNWDTILHLAGRLAPQVKLNLVPGAALQMQREIQWFKEVEKLAHHTGRERPNKDGETPAMVFTREHKELVMEGQKWMKDTANSCTIVAALIVTMVFAAAITVPGGNKDDTGLPMFSNKTAFTVFAVSDAISLFSSTTSLLMFLSILTSRYAESDFLYVLPKRLIIGVFTLFLSITTMMVAFSATLYLVFGHDIWWILIPVAVSACLPVTSFVSLQFPLLVDLIWSTYGPGIFGKQSDRPFY